MSALRRVLRARRGQATTEVVLLFPVFFFFLFAFAKVFALLILVQKLEIASFYAARRWQLESHRNIREEGFDDGQLRPDIEAKVLEYLGYDSKAYLLNYSPDNQGSSNAASASTGGFLGLTKTCRSGKRVGVSVQRTQVWNVVTVTACTSPIESPFFTSTGFVFESTKYVPNRDRPIAFVLPGLQAPP